jgi:peroxiredoxin
MARSGAGILVQRLARMRTYRCATDPGVVRTLSDSTLEQFFRVMVAALPFNLATFCRCEKMSAAVFNNIYRLYKHWSANGVDMDTLACLQQCIICCRDSQTKEDAFPSV